MKKSLLLLVAACSFALASAAHADPCPGTDGWVYADVDAADPFCAAATWLAVQGISIGCEVIDEGHRNFCPDSPTTRLQMSAFLQRMAAATAPEKVYASVYSDLGTMIALTPTYLQIAMTTTGATYNMPMDPIGGVIVPINGDYRMHYCVRTMTPITANARIAVNGTTLAGSAITRTSAGDTWCRDVIAPLLVGDTLQLQMSSELLTLVTLLGPGGAELTVERIGP